MLPCRRAHELIRPLGVKLVTLGGDFAQAVTFEDEAVRVVHQAAEDASAMVGSPIISRECSTAWLVFMVDPRPCRSSMGFNVAELSGYAAGSARFESLDAQR